MQNLILKNGLIAGVVTISIMLIGMASGIHGGALGMALGFGSMILSFCLIFIAVKQYREEMGGVLKFTPAFIIGIGISFIASIIYAAGWEAYLFSTHYTFMDEYVKTTLEAKRAAGASPEEIAKTTAQMAEYVEAYKHPISRFTITMTEIFPVGFIMSLLAAITMRGKKVA